jgi:N-acyl-D-amino-acid deacylase
MPLSDLTSLRRLIVFHGIVGLVGFLGLIGFLARPGWAQGESAQRFDLLLRGGVVHDGAGGEPREVDIGLRDGKIAAIAKLDPSRAEIVIDCQGLVIAPGFIDLHTHSDSAIVAPATRANVNYLMQGCTTVVTGNCGSGPVDVASYLDKVDQAGAGSHVIHLLPQGSLRDQVMGKLHRKPTPAELDRMRELTDKAMRDGAFGMSTGLIYVPSMFAETDELVEIATVVGRYGGFYASHIRGEGTGLLEAVNEAIEIGRRGQLPVHVSHFKAAGRDAWGTLRVAAELIEKSRAEGLKITADQYPYIASSTSLEATLLPSWSREGGRAELAKRLKDQATAEKIRSEVAAKIKSSVRVQIASYKARRDWIGKSLAEIAKLEGRDPAEIVLEIERNGGAGVVNFSMNEEDVRLAMQFPWVATASDGGAKIPTADQPHPRSYGTFPRKIGHYAIESKVLPLAAAIRSSSGLPADILGLTDRGYLREGLAADIVVFDPAMFRDRATFDSPYRLAEGIRYVFVSGTPAVHEGKPTGALAGRSIRRKPLKVTQTKPVEQLIERVAQKREAGSTTAEFYSIPLAKDLAERRSLPIGVFDSGIGGLAVLEAILTLDRHQNETGKPGADGMPDFAGERFIYLGDQANMPYGNYSSVGREDFLRELILKDAMFLVGNRYWPTVKAEQPLFDKPPVKAIVIACNTATAYGLEDIRAAMDRWKLPVPVIGVVEAGADSVAERLPREGEPEAVAVLATVGTCGSKAYPRAISRAAGQAGRRLPDVWQQGSVGLAGAIEGNPAYVRGNAASGAESVPYLGPTVANEAARIDPALVEAYAFEPAGILGDSNKPESWQIVSVSNYVRYDVTTMVENYRRSGASKPIRYVVLGCTHYPYEATRIADTLTRLKNYRNSKGDYPYRGLIAESVELIDPGELTAVQLFRRLFQERLFADHRQQSVGPDVEKVAHLESIYISVPSPNLPQKMLGADGGLTADYKYSRTAGRADVEDTRVTTLTLELLPESSRKLLQERCQQVWASFRTDRSDGLEVRRTK